MRTAIIPSLIALALPLSAQTHGITHTYTLGGTGGWDYVVPDPPRHRLFIGRSDRVMVVDMNDGRLIAQVTGINGAHGVAIVPALNRGFATSGEDSSIVMFDLRTYRPLGKIPAADDADAIVYDAASRKVLSFNGDANSATVVDPRKGARITNIPLGGKPEYGQPAGNGKIYVNLTDSSQIVEIDGRALKVTRRWSTGPCENPVPMAIDVRHQRLFSGCRNGVLAVSDYRNGRLVTTVPIGRGTDGAGYDAGTRTVYTSNGEGTLSIIHQDDADHYTVVENLKTAPFARNMGIDPATHRIYLPVADFGPPPDSTAANPRRRPPMLPGTFKVMVVEPNGSH
jgi:DNA-binding beta-propeller fold protein YncE